MFCCLRMASICGREPCTTTSLMPRLCSRLRSWTIPRKVSSATTSPPNAMTNVLSRKAWMYGAARRIHCTKARVVAEFAAGAALGSEAIVGREGLLTENLGRSGDYSAAGVMPLALRRSACDNCRLAMTSPLLAHLNPEQLEAVTLPHQSALILAGAGSGKTRVLTTRIAWLLGTRQAHPMSVLAVTFTNKAAREMLTRLSAMTPLHLRGMWIGTFHGLCNRMLRMHYREARLPQTFQILDTQDQLGLIKRVYKAHNIDEERFPARQLQYFIAGVKEEGLRPNAVDAGDPFTRRQVEH